ncbi:MAG: GerMN domain-containing protein [Deltaproteobacteria bacterium]|nr:GerMN domain-containing protein [Deltaproteobacteria bacterium]
MARSTLLQIALAFALSGCAAQRPGAPPPAPKPGAAAAHPPDAGAARTIGLHFVTRDDPFLDCRAHARVERVIAVDADPIDAAMRALIDGPTPGEEQQGLYSPFRRSVADPATPPLRASQVSVRLHPGGEAAVVSFASEAAPYLLQAICARTAVTSSIELTLLELPGIRTVRFAIDGVIIEEWDA